MKTYITKNIVHLWHHLLEKKNVVLRMCFFIVVSIRTNISSFVRANIYSFMATMCVLVCTFFSMAFTIILIKQKDVLYTMALPLI
jgi:hypothetical protein